MTDTAQVLNPTITQAQSYYEDSARLRRFAEELERAAEERASEARNLLESEESGLPKEHVQNMDEMLLHIAKRSVDNTPLDTLSVPDVAAIAGISTKKGGRKGAKQTKSSTAGRTSTKQTSSQKKTGKSEKAAAAANASGDKDASSGARKRDHGQANDTAAASSETVTGSGQENGETTNASDSGQTDVTEPSDTGPEESVKIEGVSVPKSQESRAQQIAVEARDDAADTSDPNMNCPYESGTWEYRLYMKVYNRVRRDANETESNDQAGAAAATDANESTAPETGGDAVETDESADEATDAQNGAGMNDPGPEPEPASDESKAAEQGDGDGLFAANPDRTHETTDDGAAAAATSDESDTPTDDATSAEDQERFSLDSAGEGAEQNAATDDAGDESDAEDVEMPDFLHQDET